MPHLRSRERAQALNRSGHLHTDIIGQNWQADGVADELVAHLGVLLRPHGQAVIAGVPQKTVLHRRLSNSFVEVDSIFLE